MQEKSTIGRNSGRNAVIEVESKAHLVLVVQVMRIECFDDGATFDVKIIVSHADYDFGLT